MSRSLGECRALCVKAARGSGHPWGMAEEAGFAAHWLLQRGFPGLAATASLLEWRASAGTSFTQEQCALVQGTRLMDTQALQLPSHDIYQPLLLLPFLAQIVDQIASLRFANTDVLFAFNDAVFVPAERSNLVCDYAHCTLVMHGSGSVGSDQQYRSSAEDDESVQRLEKLAEHTYAPATESSRLKGAGSGLNDND